MSSAPFNPSLVVDRLRGSLPSTFTLGTAVELAAIKSLLDFRPPQVFVVLAQETGAPRATGAPGAAARQLVTVHFGVTLAVRNYRDNRGSAATEDLTAMLGQIREALIGWVPPLPAARDCQFIQGKVLDYDANVLVWADVFQTQHAIGRTP